MVPEPLHVEILVARSYKDDAYRALLTKKVFGHSYTAESVIVTLAVALSLYNSLELLLAITGTFKKWRGLYFWSMLLSTFGVILYALGMMLMYFELCILWLSKTILDVGWILMVVCQSLVLYSRLGLVLDSDRIMRFVRWMIVFDGISLVTLTVVFDFGTTYSKKNVYPEGYSSYGRVGVLQVLPSHQIAHAAGRSVRGHFRAYYDREFTCYHNIDWIPARWRIASRTYLFGSRQKSARPTSQTRSSRDSASSPSETCWSDTLPIHRDGVCLVARMTRSCFLREKT